MQDPTDRIAHTTAFVTPIVEHWLEREIAQWADSKVRIIIIIIIIIIIVVVVVIVFNVFIITKLQSLSIQNNMYIQINSGDGRKCFF